MSRYLNSSSNTKSQANCRSTGIPSASTGSRKLTPPSAILSAFLLVLAVCGQAQAQLSAPADFGQNRYGEKRGNLTPTEVLSIVLLAMTILLGLAVTIGLCYYVDKKKKQTSGLNRVPQQGDFV